MTKTLFEKGVTFTEEVACPQKFAWWYLTSKLDVCQQLQTRNSKKQRGLNIRDEKKMGQLDLIPTFVVYFKKIGTAASTICSLLGEVKSDEHFKWWWMIGDYIRDREVIVTTKNVNIC